MTEDDPPIISIVADINSFKIIVLIERGYELYLDDNFSRILGFSYKTLKKDLLRSNLVPQINRINYLKIILILLIINIILLPIKYFY